MLKLRRIAIDTHRESIAYLSRHCTQYRVEEFQALAKIHVCADGRQIPATLNIVDDDAILAPEELGLSEEAFRVLGVPAGTLVRIEHPRPVESIAAVRAKIQGRILTAEEYGAVIRDIAALRYSKMEVAAFLVACAAFMTAEEVLYLTRAMSAVGQRLDWGDRPVVDKHCIGGIPGNRTSMIVVPIVAAHGLTIPKTSSRAITSPAGTADTMEVLARVNVGVDEMKSIVAACNGCLIWGGHVNLSPADDILISVERPLCLDTREQMVASIMSKKLAAGSTHLLIDLPVGPSAKLANGAEAMRLRKLFEFVADRFGLSVEVITTDGSQPIGNGIGPVLEAEDVMAVLAGEPGAPVDLREKSLRLAAHLLEYDPALRGGAGYARARDLLESGAALKQMHRIMDAQGPSDCNSDLGQLTFDVKAPADGIVSGIDCLQMNRLARTAGAPLDKGAGIRLFKKIGDPVEQGQPLYRVYTFDQPEYALAGASAEADSGYTITAPKPHRAKL